MKLWRYIALLSILCLLYYGESNAQCKGFTKRNCLPSLAPYLSNGQLNSAHMVPGESASVMINFNQGLSYRLLVCADPYLENLEYTLTDEGGNIFHKDTLKKAFAFTDLEVTQTKPLKLSLSIPEKKNTTGIVRNGCVTVLIGFKE